VFTRYGGPDVLVYEDVHIGQPGPGEVRVRNRAVGVNFVDIYRRTGADATPRLPFTPGKEGAGEALQSARASLASARAVAWPM
jgi:NADPH2:quinone reductase